LTATGAHSLLSVPWRLDGRRFGARFGKRDDTLPYSAPLSVSHHFRGSIE
jgi:hypothetical protein